MESNNHNDSFERFLREKADDFRMYPSRRIWYSIYNNMHPGNRLPSISMCIILLFSLLLVGYLNTGSGNQSASVNSNQLAMQPKQVQTSGLVVPVASGFNEELSAPTAVQPKESISTTRLSANIVTTSPGSDAVELAAPAPGSQMAVANTVDARTLNGTGNQLTAIRQGAAVRMEVSTPEISGTDDLAAATSNGNAHRTGLTGAAPSPVETVPQQDDNSITVNAPSAQSSIEVLEKAATTVMHDDATEKTSQPTVNPAADQQTLAIAKSSTLSETDLAWIENYAQYNRPAPKKWAGKLSLLGYVTPSVVYRSLISNVTDKPRAGTSLMAGGDVNNYLDNKPSFGIETGLAIQYQIAKRIKLKAGGQLNYTRYNARAFENFHPMATLLTMNDGYPYEVLATTPYANSFGISTVSLHNETYQLSLQLGADLRLAGFDNFEWYAGASIQPTLVLYGKSYVISTDRKSYVNDPSLLNRFNMNAGFETYISFKTSKGYTLQAGPQFRSQLFSTNTRIFSVEERLLNYGFKVGISKKL